LWSYELAAETLEDLAGIRLSHVTIGKIAQETAEKIAVKMDKENDRRKAEREAEARIVGTVNADSTSEGVVPEGEEVVPTDVIEWYSAVRGTLFAICKPDDLSLRKIAEGYAIYLYNSQRNPVSHLIVRGDKTWIGASDDFVKRNLSLYDGLESIMPLVEKIVASVEVYTGKRKPTDTKQNSETE
jgi:hypothetical protein